jgi:ArpU family phage transcriptional regulator
MAQLAFPWEIDREATRQAVEERLESARIYKQLGFVRRETKITASYEVKEGGSSNQVSKAIENAAVFNVDGENRMKEQQEQVDRAVSRLGKRERAIIEARYMEDDDVFDYNVYNDMHMGSTKYYELKSRAIYKLAFALCLEIYVVPKEETEV